MPGLSVTGKLDCIGKAAPSATPAGLVTTCTTTLTGASVSGQLTCIGNAARSPAATALVSACEAMPGLSITVGEMIETLRQVAGDETAARIRRTPDAAIKKIVAGWPRDFSAERAEAAGFVADADFSTIVRAHIADERAKADATKGNAA